MVIPMASMELMTIPAMAPEPSPEPAKVKDFV